MATANIQGFLTKVAAAAPYNPSSPANEASFAAANPGKALMETNSGPVATTPTSAAQAAKMFPTSTATAASTKSGSGSTGTTHVVTASGSSSSAASTAAAAAAKALAQAESDYGNQKNTTLASINDSINQALPTFSGSIQDYLDSAKTQQNKINNDSVQNELSKMNGSNDILTSLGHGINSAGIILGNEGAGDSSAAQAVARAYGQQGREQEGKVNEQYAQGENSVQQEQDALDDSNNTEARHVTQDKATTINTIVNQAVQALTALNQNAAYASIPDRINIDQQKAQIAAQATQALSAYDSMLNSGLAANGPATTDQNRASAATLQAAGTAPDTDFNYTTAAPATLNSPDVSTSALPVYSNTTKRILGS